MSLWLPGGKVEGGEIIRELEMVMYTLVYFKWITSKDLLYSTGNSAQYYVAAWMGGGFGGEWIHAYVWLNPFAVHPQLWQRCYLAIVQYKIKSKKKKKEEDWDASDGSVIFQLPTLGLSFSTNKMGE